MPKSNRNTPPKGVKKKASSKNTVVKNSPRTKRTKKKAPKKTSGASPSKAKRKPASSDVDNVADNLRPFTFHGVDFAKTSGPQALGQCPFCNKEGHFHVNTETGLWDCKSCGEEGNIATFLKKLHKDSLRATTDDAYGQLAEKRGLTTDVLKSYGLAKSILTGDWLLPVNNAEEKLANLLKFSGGKPLSTTGCKQHLIKSPGYRNDGPLYVTEGPWDGMALDAWLSGLKNAGSVVSVPGASTCHDQVVNLAAGRDVVLLFDNDDAGRKGMESLIKKLGPRPKSIKRIHWPSDKPQGDDLRDYWMESQDDLEAAWKRLNDWLEDVEPSDESDGNTSIHLILERYPVCSGW